MIAAGAGSYEMKDGPRDGGDGVVIGAAVTSSTNEAGDGIKRGSSAILRRCGGFLYEKN